jgi:anti-sigma factor RsiW
MECNPLAVTALVDGELSFARASGVARHLAGCPNCAGHAEFEREVAQRLRSLALTAVPRDFDGLVFALRERIVRSTAGRAN